MVWLGGSVQDIGIEGMMAVGALQISREAVRYVQDALMKLSDEVVGSRENLLVHVRAVSADLREAEKY